MHSMYPASVLLFPGVICIITTEFSGQPTAGLRAAAFLHSKVGSKQKGSTKLSSNTPLSTKSALPFFCPFPTFVKFRLKTKNNADDKFQRTLKKERGQGSNDFH